MESEQNNNIVDEKQTEEQQGVPGVEFLKRAQNPKRVEAGKRLGENNKKAKEKMLADIAEANANANEVKSTLTNYLDQMSSKRVADTQGGDKGLANYRNIRHLSLFPVHYYLQLCTYGVLDHKVPFNPPRRRNQHSHHNRDRKP